MNRFKEGTTRTRYSVVAVDDLRRLVHIIKDDVWSYKDSPSSSYFETYLIQDGLSNDEIRWLKVPEYIQEFVIDNQ